jgi:glutamate racemase
MTCPSPLADLPIGVFDSGVGGLSVFMALRRHLPRESLLYLGDMARLPYGTKGAHTVARYAEQAADILVQRGIKMLVVACNTASAVALDRLAERFSGLAVVGVIAPGAAAAAAASQNRHIAIIATEGTVRGGAYERALAALDPKLTVTSLACQLFVALAEEGWNQDPIAEQVALRYLAPLFPPLQVRDKSPPHRVPTPDCLVLGCTHFPFLLPAIRKVIGAQISVIDSGEATAVFIARWLAQHKLGRSQNRPAHLHFMSTDTPERFARLAQAFAVPDISVADIELVNL